MDIKVRNPLPTSWNALGKSVKQCMLKLALLMGSIIIHSCQILPCQGVEGRGNCSLALSVLPALQSCFYVMLCPLLLEITLGKLGGLSLSAAGLWCRKFSSAVWEAPVADISISLLYTMYIWRLWQGLGCCKRWLHLLVWLPGVCLTSTWWLLYNLSC